MEMDVETVNVIAKKKKTNKKIDDNFPWFILDHRLTSKCS